MHEWFLTGADTSHREVVDRLNGVNREAMDELMSTGAVVVCRREAGAAMRWPAVTYVRDVAHAVRSAEDAAGDKDVLVHGAVTARLALAAGVLDKLQIHLVPVLFGRGRRLFENMPPDHIELELVRALDGPGVQHLRYRARKEG